MIEGDDRVMNEEDRLGDSNRVGEFSCSLRLEVVNAVVSDVSDSST